MTPDVIVTALITAKIYGPLGLPRHDLCGQYRLNKRPSRRRDRACPCPRWWHIFTKRVTTCRGCACGQGPTLFERYWPLC